MCDDGTPSEPLKSRHLSLRAGPLTMVFDPNSGFLRYVKIGRHEVLRGVYVAVRDQNWGTVPPRIAELEVHQTEDAFQLSFTTECREGDIHFVWEGSVRGDAHGTVSYTMDGVARSTFLRNRIGFCVLHPIRECAGQHCTIEMAESENTDTNKVAAAFPRAIAPHQPFVNLRAIAHTVVPGLLAEVKFEGDVFETEDQRNWTDASFKTYCTPLDRPFPVEVAKGTRVRQAVTLSLEETTTEVKVLPEFAGSAIRLKRARAGRLPRLGLCVASHGQPLSERERKRLSRLRLDHLRVNLSLGDEGHLEVLRQAIEEAEALGTTLHVALMLADDAKERLHRLAECVRAHRPPVSAWLVFHARELSTSVRWLDLTRSALQTFCPDALFAMGTNANFTELNRVRPPRDVADMICYSINPQVHAFDNASLVETIPIQAQTVESARLFVGNTPIAISPITLKPRFNVVATSDELAPVEDTLPASVDSRQPTLFAAGWTLGSIASLSEASLHSATYYETTGWRGVMETEAGTPMPDKFGSVPGGVFPVYHLLADLGACPGAETQHLEASDPLKVQGLIVKTDDGEQMWVANMTEDAQTVEIPGDFLRASGDCRISVLDEDNKQEAMSMPERFRARACSPYSAPELRLPPFALARLSHSSQEMTP